MREFILKNLLKNCTSNSKKFKNRQKLFIYHFPFFLWKQNYISYFLKSFLRLQYHSQQDRRRWNCGKKHKSQVLYEKECPLLCLFVWRFQQRAFDFMLVVENWILEKLSIQIINIKSNKTKLITFQKSNLKSNSVENFLGYWWKMK